MTRIWVNDRFKKKLKSEAATRGVSILELTENISSFDDLETMIQKKKKGDRHLFKL